MLQLRPFQKDALSRLKKPIHLICVAPTGSGKSLIYERIAAEPGRKTLLVTPLIALARQQASQLKELGIPVTLQSGARPKPASPKESGAWIISPESLQSPRQRQSIRQWQPDFLVVDECHCLFDWGENFRKSFQYIPDLIHEAGIRRSLWLTATLPPEAHADLRKKIGDGAQTIGQFKVPENLRLEIERVPMVERPHSLLEKLSAQQMAGIIFTSTRDSTHRLQRLLQASGRRASVYHAGLSHEERCAIEDRVRLSPDEILISTSAFGMGMNYLNLRWAILWQPPASLLALAQALGRIGRASTSASLATVFWDEEDFKNLEWLYGRGARQRSAGTQLLYYLRKSACRILELENALNGSSDQFTSNSPVCLRCNYCGINTQTP